MTKQTSLVADVKCDSQNEVIFMFLSVLPKL